MHEILISLYDEMMPLCSSMASIARVLAGLGALVYISLKIWSTLADGREIDFLQLLKPFAIGLSILFFPTLVLGTLNGVLGIVSSGTESILEKEKFSVGEFQKRRDELEKISMANNPETVYLASDEEFDKEIESLGWSPSDLLTMSRMYLEKGAYEVRANVRELASEVINILFEASAIIIDTLRTFFLVVLSILGPISFSLSIWNGLEGTMSYWFSKYIQIYLWLPVSNLFSSILSRLEILIIQNQITELEAGTPKINSGYYMIFMIIGIVGYFSVPTVSEWIVQAGGAGNYNRNINRLTSGTIGLLKKIGSHVLS